MDGIESVGANRAAELLTVTFDANSGRYYLITKAIA